MKFRAAVLDAVDTPMTIAVLDMADLQPHDVLVRIRASGLCHTDLEVIQGQLAYPLPIVLGHEGAGIVEAVGADVTTVKPGDHVICSWNPYCGHCFYCDRGVRILCEPLKRNEPRGLLLDGTSRMTRDGERVHHFFTTSTHAEYAIVDESGAVAISKQIPFAAAAIIGCGVMTGVGAVVRKAKVAPGSSVLVIGCGAVGLNAIQGARLAGAARIVAADIAADRRDRATTFGATDVVDPSMPDALDTIRAMTGGRGADYTFEAAGNKEAFRLSVEATRPAGDLVWLGKIAVNDDVAFRWGSLMGEKRIVRSSYGDAMPKRDFPWLVEQYLEGRLLLDELITARIPLDRINEGFAALARGEGVRTVVELD
jgi:S-(hydroxymethyl)glutathione dehydrogenase / alcohol dehydrogenase